MITAVILAAGLGKRLRPLTDSTPKCLIEVGGKPILYRQLQSLCENDITKVVLVVGFMAEKVKEYAEEHFPDMRFSFVRNPRFADTNTLYSLALAAPHIPTESTVVQLNGDVVFDHQILKLLLETEPNNSYLATQYKKCGNEEIKIKLASAGTVEALSKEVDPESALGEAVGINKFNPQFWSVLAETLQALSEKFPEEYFEYAVEHALVKNPNIYPLDIGALYSVEIDFEEDLKKAREAAICSHGNI